MIELMVVVAIIAIFAALAVPAIISSGDDRRGFEMAHRTAQLIQSARARALATGSAHMISMTTSGFGGAADRGTFLVYQAYYDPLAGSLTPTPSANCTLPGQWTSNVYAAAPGTYPQGASSVLVNGLNYAYSSQSPIRSQFLLNGAIQGGTWALCVTPGGRTFSASSPANLGNSTPLGQPFEIQSRRYPTATPEGLTRSVVIDGSDTARVRSF